jgi:transposase
MEERLNRVVSLPRESGSAEGRMLRGDLVREMVARKERGAGVKRIARELGVDRKTVRRWLRLGGWQPRRPQLRRRPIAQFTEFIAQRGPEVGWNGVVLHRELAGLGFTGSYQQIQRYLKPYRAQRKWAELATVRFETGPGEQAQVDYGQLRVWIGEQLETVHLFVLTLGYSRRLFTYAYRNEKLASLLDGHERAFRHFGGVTLSCLYDYVPGHIIIAQDPKNTLKIFERLLVGFKEGLLGSAMEGRAAHHAAQREHLQQHRRAAQLRPRLVPIHLSFLARRVALWHTSRAR